MQKLIRARKNEKGFTLVELMVVVVIIGILVAIAIPIYSAVTANAQEKACYANLRTVDGAKTMWHMEDPTRLGTAPTLAELVTEGFLEEAPTCPTNAANVYTIAAEGKSSCAVHGSY